jgi:hypothetical protein
MILAKELEGLVRWRIAFMNESIQALLSCCHSRYEAPSQSWEILAGLFSAGSADTLDRQGGFARPFSDKPILFFDRGARGSIPIKTTKDFAWNSAIRSLRTVFVEHIEQREFCSRRRFSCHSRLLSLLRVNTPSSTAIAASPERATSPA